MRQWVDAREHFRRGNAKIIQIVALQSRNPGSRVAEMVGRFHYSPFGLNSQLDRQMAAVG